MYAVVNRRQMVPDRVTETRERARAEFFPLLEQAPGFVAFTLVQGESGVTTVLTVWEDQAQAQAFFQGDGASWMQTLDDYGHQLELRDGGEVVEYRTAQGPSPTGQ
jgi:heme-degrading monooxygenase HmoA